MIDDITTALARAHRADLTRDAARARHVRLAAGCQPAAARTNGARLLARLHVRGAGVSAPCWE